MPLASAAELRELGRAGVSFGAHSWSHADLPSLGPDALSREVLDAADRVEQITGAAVRSFAYPYGRFGMREAALVAGRYGCAVSARPSLVTAASDPMAIPRIDAHDLGMALSLGLAGSPLMVPYLQARRGARAVRSALDPARRPS
jgi:peptidoglycan/xylan/chitin deacetylase (PgdA/CDA1 family)